MKKFFGLIPTSGDYVMDTRLDETFAHEAAASAAVEMLRSFL